MSDILQKIVAHKRDEIAAAKTRVPLGAMNDRLAAAPPVRDFVGSLRSQAGIALIAEVKKASPSAGTIRDDFDPVAIAGTYEAHGAACISVLTDEQFFQGHLDDLRAVRGAVGRPVLRKDFLIDPYQIVEARAAGADCVLLIAECLDGSQLAELYAAARQLEMSVLVELYEQANLDRVLRLEPSLVGVNNRNLKTFEVDLNHTIRLAGEMPEGTLLVSESGIRNRDDVVRLQNAGIEAILVGETLMRSPDIGAKVDELLARGG